jgi:hypothetical protein
MTLFAGISGNPVAPPLMSFQLEPEVVERKTCFPPPLKPETLTNTVAALVGDTAIEVIGTRVGSPALMSL